MDIKLSIIIPVYNVAPYLRECLGSIAAAIEQCRSQSVECRTEVEVICVDDGSTDGSSEILDTYLQGETPTVKVIHQSNQGVSAARNRGLEEARGEWIGFVDADDTIDPDWLAKMMTHATEPVDWVHADAAHCFGSVGGTTERNHRTFLRDGWGVLNFVRRKVIGETRFPVGMRFKEDVVFFTELALKNPRIAWVKERGYRYRRHPGSAIEQRIKDEDSIRFCEEILKLKLPREDAARTIGFDLVLWVKGRDWSKGYEPENCPVLAFWRREMAAGRLRARDLRWWWRPGLRRWLKTGDLSLFATIRDWRVRLEIAWRKARGLPI